MVAGESGHEVAAQQSTSGQVEEQTAALHHAREPNRPLPPPAQPPEGARLGGQREDDQEVDAWLRDRPDRAHRAAEQS